MTKTNAGDHKAPALSAEEKAARDQEKHAQVSLDSGGSYDLDKLKKGFEKVVGKEGPDRETEIRKALDGASHEVTQTSPQNQLPNHRTILAEVQLASGTEVGSGRDKKEIGAVVVTEQRQVFDPKSEVDLKSAATGGQPIVGNRSEILSVQDVGTSPLPPSEVMTQDQESPE